MKQEKVILSFIMVLIGLLVAGIAFFLYQSSKTITTPTNLSKINPTPIPDSNSSFYLNVASPKDESISDTKTITVSGKTDPSATVVILTASSQDIVNPSSQGDFSTTMQIDTGVNYIKIQAILPSGETKTVQRLVSFTTEDF